MYKKYITLSEMLFPFDKLYYVSFFSFWKEHLFYLLLNFGFISPFSMDFFPHLVLFLYMFPLNF